MIKSLVFHIGDPKTGTTSIQAAMQAGACHAEGITIAVQEEANASALANSLKQVKKAPQKRQKEFSQKAKWAAESEADIGIISAEFFAGVKPGILADAIAEFFPQQGPHARIIAYARPHVDKFLSSYAQRVKTGSFQGDISAYVPLYCESKRMAQAQRFGEWKKVFDERFTLRPFVRSELKAQDVVADFFDTVLEGRPFEMGDVPKTNESLTVEELAAMRIVQGVWLERGVPDFLRLSLGGAIGRLMPQHSGRYETKPKASREIVSALSEAFEADAKELDTEFFGAPIMQSALADARDKAIATLPSYEAQSYYGRLRRWRMRHLAGKIADRLDEFPMAWRRDYQRGRSQRFDRLENEADAAKKAQNIAAVWALLEALTRSMTR